MAIQPREFDDVAGCRSPLQCESGGGLNVTSIDWRGVRQQGNPMKSFIAVRLLPDPQVRPPDRIVCLRIDWHAIGACLLITEYQPAQIAVRKISQRRMFDHVNSIRSAERRVGK